MVQQFEIVFDNASLPKNAIAALSSIISESLLKVTKEQIQISAMDGSHICLIDLKIHKSDCMKFDVNITRDVLDLGINFDDLQKIMTRVTNENYVRLYWTSVDKKIYITAINDHWEEIPLSDDEKALLPKNSRKKTKSVRSMADKERKFSMGLIDVDAEEINMSSLREMEFNSKFTLSAPDFEPMLKDSEIYSEVLQITSENEVTYSASGSLGDYMNTYKPIQMQKFETLKLSEGQFAIQFLKSIAKSAKLPIDGVYHIQLKTKSPLQMIVKISEKSEILYYLAPRVEEEPSDPYGDDESVHSEKSVTPPVIEEKAKESIKSETLKLSWNENIFLDKCQLAQSYEDILEREIPAIQLGIKNLTDNKEVAKQSDNLELAMELMKEIKMRQEDLKAKEKALSEIDKQFDAIIVNV